MRNIVSRLILRALAFTSFRTMQWKLGNPQQPLRNVVYLVAILASLHYLWSVKIISLQPPSSQGWLYSFSPYVIRSSVDDGANFVNCAACCKLHGVEGYLHVSCWLSSLIRPVFSCQLLRNRYNVRPRPPWRSFALRKRWHWRNEGIFCFLPEDSSRSLHNVRQV